MTISLVIPVYNVEKYVEKCILSCIRQQNFPKDKYEIIVVNDGSSDQSLEIIRSIDWNGIRHKVISQQNMGLSMARNNGFDIAEGEYVWFIDSDDWIANDALSIISKYLKLGVDAVSINAADVKGESVIPRFNYKLNENTVYTGKYLIEKNKWYCAVPFTVYKTEFLRANSLKFKSGIFHEDMEFTPRAFYLLRSICVETSVLYYVRQNPESITRKFNSKKNFDLITVAQSLDNYKVHNIDYCYKIYYRRYISLIINSSFVNNHELDINEKKEFVRIYSNNRKIFFNMIYSGKFKYIVEGILFMCFTPYILNIYNFFLILRKHT